MRSAKFFQRSPLLALALVLFVAYLPVTTWLFAIKNDFFYSYYPAKFFLTESIRAGEFPLWNPFINFGYPCYGDLSLSYWNPSTWLFAVMGYNAYSFTAEIILYLLLAGVGMYKLTGIWTTHKEHRLATAIAYMCSGFMIGHLQHFNWINAAGILPFVVYCFWKLLTTQDKKYVLAAILSFSYFFTAVHPGHIIAVFYLLVGLSIFHLYHQGFNKKLFIRLAYVSIGILLTLAGPLMAILDVLPFTNRSGPVQADQVLGVTDPGSWISFLLPFASTSDTSFLGNDIALRNCYIGLLPLVTLPILLTTQKRPPILFWISIAAFFLLICTSIAGSIYEHLPLINTVRLPGEFRLIALFSLLLISVVGLDQAKTPGTTLSKAFKMITWLLGSIILLALGYILATRESLIFDQHFLEENSVRTKLKAFIHSLSFADKVLIQASVQILLARWYLGYFRGSKRFSLTQIVAVEFIVISLMNLPFTGVGKKSTADIQQLIDSSPAGVLQPYSSPEQDIVKNYPLTDSIISNWGFYSKHPATRELMPYPLVLDKSSAFFSSGEHQKLYNKSFAFLNNEGTILPIQNSYRSFRFEIKAKNNDTLSVKQINFSGWKARIDGQPARLISEATILELPVPAGSHSVELYFDNKAVMILFCLHFIAMLVLVCAMISYRIRYILP